MNHRRRAKDNFDEDYSKIKPGYALKRNQVSMPPQVSGFIDTVRQDKLEARTKTLNAQAKYKLELDAQLKGKQIPKETDNYKYKRRMSDERFQNEISDPHESDNPYDNNNVVGNLKTSPIKAKNMTQAEIIRFADQQKKQQEMKDYLFLQIKEKQIKKKMEKEESDDFAKGIKVDAIQSFESEKQNKWTHKERQQQYLNDLQQQISDQQSYKKTSLW